MSFFIAACFNIAFNIAVLIVFNIALIIAASFS